MGKRHEASFCKVKMRERKEVMEVKKKNKGHKVGSSRRMIPVVGVMRGFGGAADFVVVITSFWM